VSTDASLRSDVEARLRAELAEDSLVVETVEAFGDGHSGFTYAVTALRSGERSDYVLRLSPPAATIAGPADVGRQGCLMQRLGTAGIPVPVVFAYDSLPSIGGRSFMLVERVEARNWEEAAGDTDHKAIAQAAIAALGQLQAVDLGAVSTCFGGSPALSPRDELARWLPLLTRAEEYLGQEARALWQALDEAAPQPTAPVVVHGDYHYGNLLFRDAKVVAILDWEVASTGERLIDLASLIVASLRRRYSPDPNSAGSVAIEARDLIELYGADAEDVVWFVALTCLKYAAIIGYNLRLHRTGRRVDPVYERLLGTMSGLVSDGSAVLGYGLAAKCLTREGAGPL
jgi:aminoglycoside phosphotransferase (APT) family kinase protein